MSVETLQLLSLIFLIAAGVLFLAAIAMFFMFRIPMLFGELTGITARKSIAAIQERSLHGESGSIKGSGSVSSASEQLAPGATPPPVTSPGTTKLPTVKLKELENLTTSAATSELTVEAVPTQNPAAVFRVLEELSYTSSTEIIS